MESPPGANGDSSGWAAQFIGNSIITIHKMYHTYRETLLQLIGPFANGADNMEHTFSPIPEDKTNQLKLSAALKTLPAFSKTNSDTYDNTKDTVLMLMGQTTTLAKDMLSSPDQDKWIQATVKSSE
ncbi:uncharacterized protein ColSpa_07839 [Colletotrichum spaethianum]|uniref:Uncharacterized protein n=1 Tax=Colletotrichum spaethianum TaxID=700344 RepID=A0AA37URA4_9PEZI|nr:uncharacterized protein ColSpa_07839 [Colletotrichum spaethianum]GKT47658.1 hypothetical protein ColSpa_07839 [Colletotrichum spaethianum]